MCQPREKHIMVNLFMPLIIIQILYLIRFGGNTNQKLKMKQKTISTLQFKTVKTMWTLKSFIKVSAGSCECLVAFLFSATHRKETRFTCA